MIEEVIVNTYNSIKCPINIEGVDVTTLKYKKDDENESIVIFPDGLKSIKNVQDTITIEDDTYYATKRINTIQLIETQPILDNFASIFSIFIQDMLNSSDVIDSSNILCTKYNVQQLKAGENNTNIQDKCIICYNGYIYIKDTDYDNVEDFKASLDGVMLHYILESPITYIIEPDCFIDKRYIGNHNVRAIYIGDKKIYSNTTYLLISDIEESGPGDMD